MKRYVVRVETSRWRYLRDVMRAMVVRDFKLRYKRSLLGVAWSLMVPLAQFAVLFLVFEKIVPLNIPRFTTFLLSGVLPWSWFQASLLASTVSVVDNRELVKQSGFPLAVLPPVTVISNFIHFLLAIPILAIFLAIDGYQPGLPIAALPVVIVVQFFLILSLGYFVATLQVKFRDVQYLVGIGLFLLFYLTPVFWDDSAVPEPYASYMHWNPVAVILGAYRAILIRRHWPDPVPLAIVGVGALVLLMLGLSLFSLVRNRFVEEL